MSIDTITLLGSSSGRNAGDAALIGSIMDSIDDVTGERLLYEIPTINPNFIYRSYENRVRPVSIMPWNLSLKLLGLPTYQSVMRSDLSAVFDAVLFDRSLYNPLFNMLSSLYAILPLAKKRGKRMCFFNVTTGPVTTPMGRRMLKELSEMMDFITVRDAGSLDILRDLGVNNPNVMVTADAALNTRPASEARVNQILQQLGLADASQILAFNINTYRDTWAGLKRDPLPREKFVQIYADGVSKAANEIGAPVLFVSTQHLDEEITKEVIARVKAPVKIALLSNKEFSHGEIKGVLGRVSLLAGMRLHCLILGSSAMAPILPLDYQVKIQHYVKSLGLSDYLMSFEDFSADKFGADVIRGWSAKEKIKSVLLERIPQLQHEAYKSAHVVANMRRGMDAASALQAVRGDSALTVNG